ncbi:MarR family winged helix-turn-helix transcriptional regulator [Crassaminicella indica]|uniref:MarR family transcriptional regulator n=1 Tax=Crassaminicella indica TaxID=2855394 RepID=A0ABX8R881_9CLOT|nr:MarR family transcriptional regulator [Crassaminicella indica]QXM05223.1 MarR family transcriptional regulator [Crassaminicella indica]
MKMANYYHEINRMIDKLMHKVLVYDRKGFKINGKEELSLLDIHVLRKIGQEDNKKIYELINDLEIDRGVVASVTKKLILNGYIIKERSEEDKRVYIIKLTDAGKEMYEKTLKVQKDLLDFVLSEVTLNEEKAILKFLSKINQTTLSIDQGEIIQKNNNALMGK